MVAWVKDFSDTYHASTGVYVVPQRPSHSTLADIAHPVVSPVSTSAPCLKFTTGWTDASADSDLHDDGLVDDVHGEQRRVRVDEPALDRALRVYHRHAPRGLAVSTAVLSGVHGS